MQNTGFRNGICDALKNALTLILFAGCSVSLGSYTGALYAPCGAGGAVPDDGLDDRNQLQAALDAGCLELAAGTYDIDTPAAPRPVAMLYLRAGGRITGVGPASVIAFRGDAGKRDWRGLQLANDTTVRRVSFTTGGIPAGTTNEQSHVIRGDGPVTGIRIDHNTFDHPVQPGSRRGDAIQLVGYEPAADGTGDKRIFDVDIGHNDFINAARSGVAIYGGCHRVRVHDNTFRNTKSQDFDGEGLGGCTDLEIDHNTFNVGPDQASAISVSLQNTTRAHLHDNTLNGRGMQLYGCSDCEVDHELIVQRLPISGAVLSIEKTSASVRVHDVRIVREASAGAQNVVRVWRRDTSSPDHVVIKDSVLIQHAPGNVVSGIGIVGLRLEHVSVFTDFPGWYGVDALGSAGAYATRTAEIEVIDSNFYGPLAAVLRVSGSYGGTGSVTVERTWADQAVQGLRCENMLIGGGVLGPVMYAGNTLPAPGCGALTE